MRSSSETLGRNQQRARRAATRSLAAASVCAAVLLWSAGCNIVGPLGWIVAGPEKTDALHTLDPKRSVVVFVDDRATIIQDRAMRQRIARAAESILLESGAVEKVLGSDAVLAARMGEKFGQPLGISEVGQKVGADVVIYATVDSFAISPDGVEFSPTATLRVKVIDSKSKARLWPAAETPAGEGSGAEGGSGASIAAKEWHRMESRLWTKQGSPNASASVRMKAEQDLADRVGRDLGQLFVKHETNQRDNRIGE